MNTLIKTICMGGLAAIISLASCKKDDDNNNNPRTQLDPVDTTFMNKAAQGGLAEVELGQLAASKGQAPAIRNFGQMMVNDHSGQNNELKQIASNKNYNLPNTLDPTHAMMKAMLSTLSGAKFDSVYISGQVVDHQATSTLFDNEKNNGKDQDLKNFAAKYQPAINMHLQRAITIRDSLF